MVSATITLASEAMDWIDRSMPPSMMTKLTPGRQHEEHGGVAGQLQQRRARRGTRAAASRPRAQSTTSVATGSHCRSRSRSRRRACHAGFAPSAPSDHVPDQLDLLRLAARRGVARGA